MTSRIRQRQRRCFLKQAAAAVATGCTICSAGATDAPAVVLDDSHLRAVNRRRRITVQHDGYNALGKDWNQWLKYRFRWIDAPDVQIDSVWWDIQPLLKGYYPTPPDSLVYHWPEAQTDIVLSGASEDDQFDVSMNKNRLASPMRDATRKDPQISIRRPVPASGGRADRYRIDPRQQLLRLQYVVTAECCLVGENQVKIQHVNTSRRDLSGEVVVEKVEVTVRYE